MSTIDFLKANKKDDEVSSDEKPPSKFSRFRPKKRVFVLFFIFIVGIFLPYQIFTDYIYPYEWAVRESRYSGGLDKNYIAGPGIFITGPGVTYHRFPLVTQTLTMAISKHEDSVATDAHRTINALEIDSFDGAKITIDSTIMYRILDPYKVITKIGPGRLFEDNSLIPKSMQALKENLGMLKAEDFYDEKLRIRATELAKQSLNRSLEPFGIRVDFVLIRQYYYLKAYQTQIEEKKVQDQLVFTNQSMAEAAKIIAMKQKIDAEGDGNAGLERKRGETEITKIKSEAELYSRKKRAEGDLLVSLALAQGRELENLAYKSGLGSENLVGMEMAEVLNGLDVIFIQSGKDGNNLLDINQTLQMFDVK